MRSALVTCFAVVGVLGLLCIPVYAEELSFDGGSLTYVWSGDMQDFTIQATINRLSPPSETHTWILTLYSHRFEDGVFAWQLHFSETIDSVLVLPNDFLTARHFTTAQLGIEVQLSMLGNQLTLRLPTVGTIPHLVAVGDLIELHALWIQQAPLVSVRVPAPDALSDAPAGGGASFPDSNGGAISTSPLPEADRFEQGLPISHQFTLQEQPAPDSVQRIVLSYTLMRLHEDQANEFARFAHISYDFDSASYYYTIDTSRLAPGKYSLLIGSSNSDLSYRMELEIVDPI